MWFGELSVLAPWIQLYLGFWDYFKGVGWALSSFILDFLEFFNFQSPLLTHFILTPIAQIWRKSRIDYCKKSCWRLCYIFIVSRRMVADKYIRHDISEFRRELPTQWCGNCLCSMHMDEVVSRWRRRKKSCNKKRDCKFNFGPVLPADKPPGVSYMQWEESP